MEIKPADKMRLAERALNFMLGSQSVTKDFTKAAAQEFLEDISRDPRASLDLLRKISYVNAEFRFIAATREEAFRCVLPGYERDIIGLSNAYAAALEQRAEKPVLQAIMAATGADAADAAAFREAGFTKLAALSPGGSAA